MPDPTTTINGLPYPVGEDFAINGPLEIKALAEALDAILPPIGIVSDYGGSADPNSAWMICNGRELNRLTYAKLFSKIGTTYGEGNKTTTFNIPDCRGRATIGAGTGTGLTSRALGSKTGEEVVKLSVGQLPSHNHSGKTSTESATHVHGFGPGTVAMVDPVFAAGGGGAGQVGNGVVTQTGENSGTHTHVVSPEGAGESHANMQPSIALNKIIRVL